MRLRYTFLEDSLGFKFLLDPESNARVLIKAHQGNGASLELVKKQDTEKKKLNLEMRT